MKLRRDGSSFDRRIAKSEAKRARYEKRRKQSLHSMKSRESAWTRMVERTGAQLRNKHMCWRLRCTRIACGIQYRFGISLGWECWGPDAARNGIPDLRIGFFIYFWESTLFVGITNEKKHEEPTK